MNAKKIVSILAGSLLTLSLFAQEFDAAQEVSAKMVLVEKGTFLMGSADNEDNELPVREVSLDSYYIMQTEVTQAEYAAVMGDSENFSAFPGSDRPVEEVSWYDAVVFCNKLSLKAGLTPVYSLAGSTDPSEWGAVPRVTDNNRIARMTWNAIECDFSADGYRLPTEAEWEFAANGGVSEASLYASGDTLEDGAWFLANSLDETHPVAEKTPNALGIYDMNGNVWEWCWDWYGNYHKADSVNPRGEKDSSVTGKRIRRGGSIKSAPEFCRNANRASSVPELRGVDLGLRLVRTQVAAAEETSPAAIDLTTGTEAEILEGEIEDLSTGSFDAVEK